MVAFFKLLVTGLLACTVVSNPLPASEPAEHLDNRAVRKQALLAASPRNLVLVISYEGYTLQELYAQFPGLTLSQIKGRWLTTTTEGFLNHLRAAANSDAWNWWMNTIRGVGAEATHGLMFTDDVTKVVYRASIDLTQGNQVVLQDYVVTPVTNWLESLGINVNVVPGAAIAPGTTNSTGSSDLMQEPHQLISYPAGQCGPKVYNWIWQWPLGTPSLSTSVTGAVPFCQPA